MVNKLNRILIALTICCFGSCSPSYNGERFWLSAKLTRDYCKLIKKKYHVSCGGDGGGYFDGKINHINIDFRINEPFELEKSRKLIRNIISELKFFSNKYKECAIYYPGQIFSYNRFHIMFVYEVKGEPVAYVHFIGGKILYEPLKPNSSKEELVAWEVYDEDILHLGSDPGPYD